MKGNRCRCRNGCIQRPTLSRKRITFTFGFRTDPWLRFSVRLESTNKSQNESLKWRSNYVNFFSYLDKRNPPLNFWSCNYFVLTLLMLNKIQVFIKTTKIRLRVDLPWIRWRRRTRMWGGAKCYNHYAALCAGRRNLEERNNILYHHQWFVLPLLSREPQKSTSGERGRALTTVIIEPVGRKRRGKSFPNGRFNVACPSTRSTIHQYFFLFCIFH